MEKLPSRSVDVPTVVPFTITVAPIAPRPEASLTVPVSNFADAAAGLTAESLVLRII